MGHYEIPELKELENLSKEYATKFGLDMGELEAEFEKHVKIGEELLRDTRSFIDKVHERWMWRDTTVSFREICLNTLIWGNSFDVQYKNERLEEHLFNLRKRNPKGYDTVLNHARKISYLSQTLQELKKMAKAHMFLEKSTPRTLLFNR